MRFKALSLAPLAILAFAAVFASSAMATATESNGFWYIEGVKLESGVEHAMDLSCHSEGNFVLTSTVGSSNTPLKLQATGIACPEGKVFNDSSKAKATGKVKFTGVTVVEPAGCSVVGVSVETEALKAQVWMEGSKALVRFAPAVGTTLAEVEITGCAIANAYPTKGVIFGESANATGVSVGEQKVTLSGAINTAAGGSLTFGGHSAALAGVGKFVIWRNDPMGTIDYTFSAKET